MKGVVIATLAAFTLAGARTASGQSGGQLDAQTQYQLLSGPSQGNQRGPLLAIVLWRGEPGWNASHSAVERERVDSIFRWTRLRADESGQSFFGSGLYYGLMDLSYKTVIVEGQTFDLSRRDSVVVIMVTVPPAGLPREVTWTNIVPALPEEFWSKSWTSGDTTYFVHPDFRRGQAMLRQALSQSPTIAAFLR